MQMHRDRHNDSMHAVPIQPLKFISPPRNSWNHRLLLSVTPRRANDVPRCYHHYFRAYNVYGSLSVPAGHTIRPLSVPAGHTVVCNVAFSPRWAHDRYSKIHIWIHCRSHPTRAHDVHNNAIRLHNLFKQCNKHIGLSKHCNKCGLSKHCAQSAYHHDACHIKTHATQMHISYPPWQLYHQ